MKRESTTIDFFLEVLENGIEDFVSGYRMIVIKVIIDSCFLVNIKTFYWVKMNIVFLELYYLHGVVHISKSI
jgi:hypothetical protein